MRADAQRDKFSLLFEAGLGFSQIDGDKLSGYDKRAPYLAVGSNYLLHNHVVWGVELLYANIGSKRADEFQDKLPGGSQLEFNLHTVGIGSYLLYKHTDHKLFTSVGLDLRQILSADVNIVDNVVDMPDRRFPDNGLTTRYVNFKFSIGWVLSHKLRFSGTIERAFQNLMKEEYLGVDLMTPYGVTLKFTYELNSVFKESNKKKTKKKRNRAK